MEVKKCLFCQKEFEPKKKRSFYCSDKCRVYANRKADEIGGFVYCLKNPLLNNEIFYIGKTLLPLHHRLWGHKAQASKSSDEKSLVLNSLKDAGVEPIIEFVEMIEGDSKDVVNSRLLEREKYWISEYIKSTNLLNKHKTLYGKYQVRFDEELLTNLKNAGLAESPQKALNLFERSYMELIRLKVEINNRPENKERIESDRNPILSQNKPVEGELRQTDDVPNLGRKKKPDVKIQDLTNQSKTNYSIDTTKTSSSRRIGVVEFTENGSVKLTDDEAKARIDAKIEELTKSANSCADTKLGRLAKAGYLKQITELQSLLKIK